MAISSTSLKGPFLARVETAVTKAARDNTYRIDTGMRVPMGVSFIRNCKGLMVGKAIANTDADGLQSVEVVFFASGNMKGYQDGNKLLRKVGSRVAPILA